jgi:hypothetical protein
MKRHTEKMRQNNYAQNTPKIRPNVPLCLLRGLQTGLGIPAPNRAMSTWSGREKTESATGVG